MPITNRMQAVTDAYKALGDFVARSQWARRGREPGVFDFTFGNPQEMPIAGFAETLQRWALPRNKDWYAYKLSERETRQSIAASLNRWRGIAFDAEDIAVTNGAFGAIAVAFATFVEPGDEVVYSLPQWFGYGPMLAHAGAAGVQVRVHPQTFDLDLDGIEAAITTRTRMVIVNTPNNPTGKVYSADTLKNLAAVLTRASHRYGRPIYLLSDEPYSRLVFGGSAFHSPTEFYNYAMISYSYGKVLLTPGQRIGYLALPPSMPEREERREQIMTAQIAAGWLFPNALLQHAIDDLDAMSIDLAELEYKRDLMVHGLREIGYEIHSPDGTFYLLPKSPIQDDMVFTDILARRDVFVMPGTICSSPGYFRITLSASRERLAESLAIFRAALDDVRRDAAR